MKLTGKVTDDDLKRMLQSITSSKSKATGSFIDMIAKQSPSSNPYFNTSKTLLAKPKKLKTNFNKSLNRSSSRT